MLTVGAGSLACDSADEAKTLIPSLATKMNDDVLQSLLDEMTKLRAFNFAHSAESHTNFSDRGPFWIDWEHAAKELGEIMGTRKAHCMNCSV